jgi:hypothetical protein
VPSQKGGNLIIVQPGNMTDIVGEDGEAFDCGEGEQSAVHRETAPIVLVDGADGRTAAGDDGLPTLHIRVTFDVGMCNISRLLSNDEGTSRSE